MIPTVLFIFMFLEFFENFRIFMYMYVLNDLHLIEIFH